MKGFVPTPPELVDEMVNKLFAHRVPKPTDHLLDPGCGEGAFIEGVLRWGRRNGSQVPRIVGVDSDPTLLAVAKSRIGQVPSVELVERDFLSSFQESFDFIIGNPPYVAITGLTEGERVRYRSAYTTAVGRFDLYHLFFEQAIRLLAPGGRLVFVTPEKYLYVQTTDRLRRLLSSVGVEEIRLVDEAAFSGRVTYPTITILDRTHGAKPSSIVLRDGTSRTFLPRVELGSWLPSLNGSKNTDSDSGVLADAFSRISCGVATGADEVFVLRSPDVPPELEGFAYPTISGRTLRSMGRGDPTHQMIVPYTMTGELIPESDLGSLGIYLNEPRRRSRLMMRTCVSRKPWYAFHETPPMSEMFTPKILCKDISQRPEFVVDESGDVLPRHSVYYLIPEDPERITEMCAYLNSDAVKEFLMANCQRAANGFIRLQSHILKQIPVPPSLLDSNQLALR